MLPNLAVRWPLASSKFGCFDESAGAFNFVTEFIFGREVAHVFRGEELLAAFQH